MYSPFKTHSSNHNRVVITYDPSLLLIDEPAKFIRNNRDGTKTDITDRRFLFEMEPDILTWGWHAFVAGAGEVCHLVNHTHPFPDPPATCPGTRKNGTPAMWHKVAYANVRVDDALSIPSKIKIDDVDLFEIIKELCVKHEKLKAVLTSFNSTNPNFTILKTY
jgi:hypothetical protein